ncbi:MAG: hypothetical protein APF77_00745 [Clostridia bacterium BRH_c25]|nr:MAG: hypothetical protein APF77_00745 [Clostridia bacterium BRH_c25]
MLSQYECDIIEKGIDISWTTWGKMRNSSLTIGEVSYVKSDNNKGPERIFKINFTGEDIDEKIMKMISYIKAGIMPDSMLITPDTTPVNLAELLAEKGFCIDDSDPCMMLELDNFNYQRNINENISVVALENDELLTEWVKIVSEALFECELITLNQFKDVFKLDNTHFYLGLKNGIPASACMTITDGDTSVLEMVATLKQYRHNGLATAVVSKALDDLKKLGTKTISLRAEKDGVNLYKHLGFKECFNRIVASCDWSRIYKNACPCRIEAETIAKAQEIFRISPDISSFINKMEEQHVIGKTIRYNDQENAIYITKLYACDCGSNCSTNNSIIGQRCHCEYVNDINCIIPISYCKCSSAFFEPLFTPLFGDNIVIEPVETVLSGGEQCTFKCTGISTSL